MIIVTAAIIKATLVMMEKVLFKYRFLSLISYMVSFSSVAHICKITNIVKLWYVRNNSGTTNQKKIVIVIQMRQML